MLPDLLTLLLVVQARDVLAARQFLCYLTQSSRPPGVPANMNYSKMLLTRVAALTAAIDGQAWLEQVFDENI